MAGLFAPGTQTMDVNWKDKARQQERGFSFENRYAYAPHADECARKLSDLYKKYAMGQISENELADRVAALAGGISDELLKNVFSKYEEKLSDLYKKYAMGQISENELADRVAALAGGISDELGQLVGLLELVSWCWALPSACETTPGCRMMVAGGRGTRRTGPTAWSAGRTTRACVLVLGLTQCLRDNAGLPDDGGWRQRRRRRHQRAGGPAATAATAGTAQPVPQVSATTAGRR